jgi:hypothetical protein
MAVGLAPVRQTSPPVVHDIHVHELAEASHGDRDGGRVRGVLNGVRDQFASKQFGIRRAGMVGQAFSDEPPRGWDFLGPSGERAGLCGVGCRLRGLLGGLAGGRGGTAPDPLRANGCDGRSGHIGLRIVRDY